MNQKFPYQRIFLPASIAAALLAAIPSHARTITADFGSQVAALPQFWNGSGMNHNAPQTTDPNWPKYGERYLTPVISADMQMIGSEPFQGIHWQRAHYLLRLPQIISTSTTPWNIQWGNFDKIMDDIINSGQTPFFELMGFPTGSPFSDPGITAQNTAFQNASNIQWWRTYVAQVARHCISRYGSTQVRQWNFEVWNEPDSWPADNLNNYYDASRAGLDDADTQLHFGGPGCYQAYNANIYGLVDHCINGTNYFTKTKGTRIDFISFHVKNGADAQASYSHDLIKDLKSKYALAGKAFWDSEADADSGWWHEGSGYEQRATPWYAKYIARQVMLSQSQINIGLGVEFHLQDDDAFIGDFANRTQFAWFGNETAFSLIKKPSHNVRDMLSLQGDQQYASSGGTTDLTSLASRRGTTQAALLINNYSSTTSATTATTINVQLKNLPFATGKLAEYRIDPSNSNVYKVWQGMGSPTSPSQSQIQTLRDNQELKRLNLTDITSANTNLTLNLPVQGVSLLLASADPGAAPVPPTGLAGTRYTSSASGRDDILLKWQNTSRVVKTFEVEFSTAAGGPFARVNTPDVISNSFTHQIAAGSGGFYRVRAVDFWSRTSGYSNVASVGGVSGGVRYETENLTVANFLSTSGGTERLLGADPRLSNGDGTLLESNNAGDYVTFLIPNTAAGNYNVKIGMKKNTTRGQFQCQIGRADSFSSSAQNFGALVDEYSSSPGVSEVDLGTWSPGSTSDKWFRFNVVGKNAASTGGTYNYELAFDYITLTPQ